jgi:hypothetical protein
MVVLLRLWSRSACTARRGVAARFVAACLASGLVVAGCDDGGEPASANQADASAADAGCPPGHTTTDTGCACVAGLDEDGDGLCDGDRADWSASAKMPASGERRDIYKLGPKLPAVAQEGLLYTHAWPVTVSGVLLPWEPMAFVFEPGATDEQRVTAQDLARSMLGFGNLTEMYAWLGLQPRSADPEAYPGVAWPASIPEGAFVGAGHVKLPSGDALTFSCATCHTGRVFGKTVFGLTNRQTKANSFFGLGKQFFPDHHRGHLSQPDFGQ